MEHLQQQRLRLAPLTPRLFPRGISFTGGAILLAAVTLAHAAPRPGKPVPVKGANPPATLQQEGRTTYIKVPGTAASHLALTHPSDYPEGLNPPFAAAMIGSSPRHFLIFTDSFVSNPGNPQGECGASETGERYLHVVTLANQPRETLSVLVESCRQNIVPAASPHWSAKTATLTVNLQTSDHGPTNLIYHVTPDGDASPKPAQ